MLTKLLYRFRYFDLPLLAATLLLAAAGLALLYSVATSSGQQGTVWRQLVYALVGLLAMVGLSGFDYHRLAKLNRAGYILCVLVLLYLLLFGHFARGGRRWIDFGLFTVQVGELAKVVVIVGLARIFYLQRGGINTWWSIARSFVYAAVPAGLVLLEPDLGSALVIFAIWAGTVLLSPIKKRFVLSLLAAGLIATGIGWRFFLKPFQRDRILVFLNPELDPRGRGYNVRQAAIAVGSGGAFGRGFGRGLQTEHRFLPERNTDFIFAASAEEIGFVGSGVLLLLYGIVLYRALSVAEQARDDLGTYIAGGTFFFLFAHVAVNVGMNVGLLPVTGIPLPLVSAGGSNVIATLASLGILQNVAVQSKVLRF